MKALEDYLISEIKFQKRINNKVNSVLNKYRPIFHVGSLEEIAYVKLLVQQTIEMQKLHRATVKFCKDVINEKQ